MSPASAILENCCVSALSDVAHIFRLGNGWTGLLFLHRTVHYLKERRQHGAVPKKL